MDAVREALKEKGWDQRLRWDTVGKPARPEQMKAVIDYVVRMMAKGRIPSASVIDEALLGKREVPECGYIDCRCEGPHVH